MRDTGWRASDADFRRQLQGYGLSTVEISYYMPDHPALLQLFICQHYDVAPQFPVAAGAVQALSDEGSRRGLPDFTPLWAGQAASLGRPTSASELTRNLSQEAFALLRSLAEQAPGVRPGP